MKKRFLFQIKLLLKGATKFIILLNILCICVLIYALLYLNNNMFRDIVIIVNSIIIGSCIYHIFKKCIIIKEFCKHIDNAVNDFHGFLAWKKAHPDIDDEYYFENILKTKKGDFDYED